jgi:hypothetical protein
MTTKLSPQHLLRDVLSRNPGVSLAEIRGFHPVFRTMSVDQLSLRLSRVIDSASDARGK